MNLPGKAIWHHTKVWTPLGRYGSSLVETKGVINEDVVSDLQPQGTQFCQEYLHLCCIPGWRYHHQSACCSQSLSRAGQQDREFNMEI